MHCNTVQFSIGKFLVEKNAVQDNPPYQRESAVWSEDKQQLFIDSLFNGYDIPKIYFHDLRGLNPRYDFAVIDGKQRLHTIWSFLNGDLRLAYDFKVAEPRNRISPHGGSSFFDLSSDWQELFKAITIDVVLVQNATEDDIEELFSRLNNGEPLNAAEKRNARGGDMTDLIRELSGHKFFMDKVRFNNDRYKYYDVATRFLLLEKNDIDNGHIFSSLQKSKLDSLVENHRRMSKGDIDKLRKRVEERLADMCQVFANNDPLLSKQSFAPLYFLFVKLVRREYGHPKINSYLHEFLEGFNVDRQKNLQKPEDQRDNVMMEFGRLSQQGTVDVGNLEERASILRRYFLLKFPDVTLTDKKRAFTEEERFAIWVLGERKCATCSRSLVELSEMHADHVEQWAYGGQTVLSNARCLCVGCNTSGASV